VKWKSSIDESARFADGDFLPCLLIQNKVDLVSEEIIKNDSEVKEFAETNKFIGMYRTSAKAGINVSESMECLIQHIINKLQACKLIKTGGDNKKGIVLDGKKSDSQKKNKCC
jgi:translation elongation factor EF-4